MDEFLDLLAAFINKIRVDDLKDPELAAMVSQLLSILEQDAYPLQAEFAEELLEISDKIERFKLAAMKLGIINPAELKKLVHSMQSSGLL